MKRRKNWMALLLTGCMLFGITGCGNSVSNNGNVETPEKTEEIAVERDPVTLKWAIWDQQSKPYWDNLKDAYEKEHPNVTIELVDLGSTDYMTVLTTELSGSGTDFDIVSIKDVPGYATLVHKEVILPLNDYIERDGIDLEAYAGTTDQVTVDGQLYQMPFGSSFWVLYYNKDIFDAAGVDYPTNDMTFEEYDSLARAVTNTTFGEQVYGAHYHTWRSAVQLFGVLDGKHSILDGDYSFTKPYYEMVLNEEKDGVCQTYSDLKTEGLHYSAAFANGNVAMMNQGTWYISTLIANLKSGEYDSDLCGNWGIVKYPHADGVEPGSTLGTISGISITKECKNPEAAWEFVKWISGEEGAAIMTECGEFPAIMSEKVRDIIAGMDGFPTDEASKEALEVSNLYFEVPYADNVSEINSILDSYHASIMSGEMGIDEGIKAMNEAVSELK